MEARAAIGAIVLLLVSAAAWADDPPAPAEPEAGKEQAAAEPEPSVGIQIAVAEDKKKDAEPLKLPPGFKAKKRGKYTVYCQKDTPMGSRFPSEKCYDERGMRDYIADQRENQKQVDQMRRICGSMEACGGGN